MRIHQNGLDAKNVNIGASYALIKFSTVSVHETVFVCVYVCVGVVVVVRERRVEGEKGRREVEVEREHEYLSMREFVVFYFLLSSMDTGKKHF